MARVTAATVSPPVWCRCGTTVRVAVGPTPRSSRRQEIAASGAAPCLVRVHGIDRPQPHLVADAGGPRSESVIALGLSSTGKTYVALGLGLTACQKGFAVGFTSTAALSHELMKARGERQLMRLQKRIASHTLLIIDELASRRSRRPGLSCTSS